MRIASFFNNNMRIMALDISSNVHFDFEHTMHDVHEIDPPNINLVETGGSVN